MLLYDSKEVNIYGATTIDIDINGKAMLTGYFSKKTGMWHILCKKNVENETTDILVVNRTEILHAVLYMYELP